MAQAHAENCKFAHNENRHSQQDEFTFIGENLAAGSGEADFPGFVTGWYNEVHDYTYETNTCASGKACGHYTQVYVIW